MTFKKFLGFTLLVVGAGLVVVPGLILWRSYPVGPASNNINLGVGEGSPTPIWHSEPLVPTAAPATAGQRNPDEDSGAAEAALPVIAQTVANPSENVGSDHLHRFGLGVAFPPFDDAVADQLPFGWYLTWRVAEAPERPGGIDFWQMVRLSEERYRPEKAIIQTIARQNPGSTWLIGNEPDVIWQDNVTPARYAELYHELYQLLKKADPDSEIAIGGVTQPTPLRLRYLDEVMIAYETGYGQAMPVDVWNIHNFILQEKRDSWGVSIPPGLDADQGVLYTVAQHDDLEIFEQQLIDFRRWMAQHGQRDKPLIVSEYGILMPQDYGFDVERVKRFMVGSYQIMLNTTDSELGYPADENRLVQGWAWFSLNDNIYPTGNLIDPQTKKLTEIGQTHRDFVTTLKTRVK